MKFEKEDYEKRLRDYLNSDIDQTYKNMLLNLFPELAESEDERIRKEILEYFQQFENEELRGVNISDWIAWLERQGGSIKEHTVCETCDEQASCVNPCPMKLVEEQKPTDKVEPKFKVGDTIAKKHNSDIHDFGSFTITDITGGKYWYNDRIICDITEQDEWEIYELVRQKPAWSEDDQSNFNELSSFIFETYRTEDTSRLITWLESLKNRVLPQPMQEWSEEDEKNIESIESFLRCPSSIPLDLYNTLTNWLKSLRPQSHWKPSEEQMKAMQKALVDLCGKDEHNIITGLYYDLKKLREE